MFSFFHRTPEIQLDCFTSDNLVYMSTPIIKAGKAIPDWWKELRPHEPMFHHTSEEPFHLVENPTARDCYAIIELYKRGVIVENWTDIAFRTENKSYNYWYAHGVPPEDHPRRQLGNSFPDHHHIKLISPWCFREKTGAKFIWLGAEWSLDKYEIKVLPGVLNFDIISQINVNMMFPMRDGIFTLTAGTPLVHLVPLSEKKLRVRNHLVTKQEFDKLSLNSSKMSFFGWKKGIQLRKRNKERGTCPFNGDNND